jgi:hypothetical protein
VYVLVHHEIRDPDRFWSIVQRADVPAEMKLHHTFPARDGSRATCLWEAESVDAVRDLVEPLLGGVSSNEYSEAENREGIAMPSMLPA